MKLKHKIARPGYSNSAFPMSPLNQNAVYSNKIWRIFFDEYAFDVENYDKSRNDQLSQMTPEQLENVAQNDTIFNNPTDWNKTQVAVDEPGSIPYWSDGTILKTPIYAPNTIAQDAGYSVVNPVDASLNRSSDDPRNVPVTSIPPILSFTEGRKKNLVKSGQEARTNVQTYKDMEGTQVSKAQYNQLMKTVQDQTKAQEEYDAESERLVGLNSNE